MLRGKKFRDAFLVTYGCKTHSRQGHQGFLMRQQTTRSVSGPKTFICCLIHA